MTVTWIDKPRLTEVVLQRVLATRVVLDVGPGIRPQTLIDAELQIFVEAHRPYVDRLRQAVGPSRLAVFLNGRWEAALALLPERSVDTVLALDFIEHLEKEDGRRFVAEAARVASEQVVVFTPLGFYPQSYDDPAESDRWGMDGAYWQTHRSGWTPDDFDDNWDVVCCRAFHTVDAHDQPLAEPFGALWAFRNCRRRGDVAGVEVARSLWPSVAAARRTSPRRRVAAALRAILPGPAYRALRSSFLRLLTRRH